MHGDITRETFRTDRHYWGVLNQQGRVDVDADRLEQVRIARHLEVTRTADIIGRTGGPEEGAGFAVVEADGTIGITPGRYYVAGQLCENDSSSDGSTPVGFDEQPDHHGDPPPGTAGLHLAYLDVWDRHVTALDDPLLREVVLGGPDTSTRARTVWQVRTRPITTTSDPTSAIDALKAAAGDPDAEQAARLRLLRMARSDLCATPLEATSPPASTGALKATTDQDSTDTNDPCRFEPGGGYRRRENRLYRVEIHQAGPRTGEQRATYKWSRNNGSFVVSVEWFPNANGGTTDEVRVRQLGLDDSQELKLGDLVEIVSDDQINAGRPGQLRHITNQPTPTDRVLKLSERVDAKGADLHPQVRLWHGSGSLSARPHDLDEGIEILFRTGTYATGDHWLIPARANKADVEWPPFPEYPDEPVGPAEYVKPRRITHHYASLAVVVHDGNAVVDTLDLRNLFPAGTGLVVFQSAGGDGQEPVPVGGGRWRLPQPLEASVTRGGRPVAGRLVRFEVVDPDPEDPAAPEVIDGTSELNGTSPSVDVQSDLDGIARVDWELTAQHKTDHRVRARLLDDCGIETHAPVFYNTSLDFKMHYMCGGGQSAMPGEPIEPIAVWVSAGRWPVEGVKVHFEPDKGCGTVAPPQVTTTDNGVAKANWNLDRATPNQRVRAALFVPVPGADEPVQVQTATVCFDASLNVASEVAYTPRVGCSLTAITVQEALDELCLVPRGGDGCTVSFGPLDSGEKIREALNVVQESGVEDINICFAEGEYEIDQPMRFEGFRHISVSGVGPGTHIKNVVSTSVFHFEKCETVCLHDVSVTGPGNGSSDDVGVVMVRGCGATTIERVRSTCGAGGGWNTVSILVARDESSIYGINHPVRVRDCDVVVGERQDGIVVTAGKTILVEGNTVAFRSFGELSFTEFFTDDGMVESALPLLVDFASDIDLDVRRNRGDTRSKIELPEHGVSFLSPVDSERIWRDEIGRRRPTTAEEARVAALDVARKVLREAGKIGNRRVFRSWYDKAVEASTLPGNLGISASSASSDVTVRSNRVGGMFQGIMGKGLSSLVVVGNAIEILPSSIFFPGGIVFRDVESLVISKNVVRADEGGVGVYCSGGTVGPRMVISSNDLVSTSQGIWILESVNPSAEVGRWVTRDNVATGPKPALEAPIWVYEDGNVPPREPPSDEDHPYLGAHPR